MPRGTRVNDSKSLIYFGYRTLTPYGSPFQMLHLYIKFVTLRPIRNSVQSPPTTPDIQRFRSLTYPWFRLFPFRSPLLGKSLHCFLFLRLLRCFSSPRSPPYPIYSDMDDTVLTVPGFPIQIPPDQRSLGNSPMLFAAHHVFLRLLAPRHPPLALYSLATNHLIQLRQLLPTSTLFLFTCFFTLKFSKNESSAPQNAN